MNSIENRFYLAATDVRNNEYQKTKDNAVYLWRILFDIIVRTKRNPETFEKEGLSGAIGSSYLAQLMTGKLFHPDVTNGTEIGQKLKQLVLLLDDPENREKFANSWFCTAIVTVRNGAVQGDINSEGWEVYQTYNGPRKSALNYALSAYKDTPGIDVGLNFNALFNTIVRKNEKGKYEITDITMSEGDKLQEATNEFIKILKENKNFKDKYYNSVKESEYGM